jgi:hypothetical protein
MVRTRSSKGMYDDVPKSSTHRHGAFHPPMPPPSPPTPPVSLEQLLALQNAIMQRLAEIDEHQAGQSQHQQPQESSYFDFLVTQPLEFTETTDPLVDNHWLHVTESKFGLLQCSEFQKAFLQHNSSVVLQVHGGPCILPLFRTITECHGLSSAQHSTGTTFQ